jgi:hypothetical protein
MGAHYVAPVTAGVPLRLMLILTPLYALLIALGCVAMCLLIYVSIPISALFTGVPFAILHLFLRWIGH